MKIVDFISSERLRTFEAHTDMQHRAIALHNQTLQLGSSLMSLIALLELALRNTTNSRLIEDFGDPNWLLPGHTSVPLRPFEQSAVRSAIRYARKAAYSKLSYREKGHLDAFAFPVGVPAGLNHQEVVRQRQNLFVVSHGQVISQTTFSFWKRLYSEEYDATLWKRSLKRVFPNKSFRRSDFSKALEMIYVARNRVAHHEPIYGAKLDQAVEAFDFIRDHLGARNIGEDTSFKHFSRIQHLRVKMDLEAYRDAWATLTMPKP